MKTYQLAAGLEGFRTSRGDGTIKLTFGTQELSPEMMANIHWSLNKVGWLCFSPDPFASHELEEIEKLKVEFEDTGKSPSKRLQAVFYRLWEQKPESYKVFNDYYIAQMEKLVNHFKGKLE
jgi:hypothetical protein